MTDFTAFAHPVLAVACPVCHQRPGQWCQHVSGLPTLDLHPARQIAADRLFQAEQGPDAIMIRAPLSGTWEIDPRGNIRD